MDAMFTRYSPTKVKGSVVVHGSKSLASKLHPQLPLQHKESQRLPTISTFCCRRYSRRVDGEGGRPDGCSGTASMSRREGRHLPFSAALADSHPASVVRNTLHTKCTEVGQRTLDYASAERYLVENSDKDPIALLEEYQWQGAATVPIAMLCLQTFENRIDRLLENQRQDAVREINAGRRTLSWLWESNMHNTDAFVDHVKFMDSMICLVLQEGFEDLLWPGISRPTTRLPNSRRASGFPLALEISPCTRNRVCEATRQ